MTCSTDCTLPPRLAGGCDRLTELNSSTALSASSDRKQAAHTAGRHGRFAELKQEAENTPLPFEQSYPLCKTLFTKQAGSSLDAWWKTERKRVYFISGWSHWQE